MCGIAGRLRFGGDAESLHPTLDALIHRGPDERGTFSDDRIALAATRLAILDVEHGQQPRTSEAGDIVVIQNGEIVNTPELAHALERAGHAMRTRSDTEAILRAYQAWGADAIQRLRGMFAIAIWDHGRGRLLLARDRHGMKPLYVRRTGDGLAFASEIKALLRATDGPVHADRRSLAELFEIGYIPEPRTGFEEIETVPAAHMLVVDARGARLRRYWQVPSPIAGMHEPANPRAVRTQIEDAVRTWTLSDVPVASLLSGGLDSSVLAALLSRDAGPIHTFSIGFFDRAQDETAHAKTVATAIESTHHELFFEPDAFGDLPRVVEHLEAPQCAAAALPIFRLYQRCHAEGFKVVLTGEGADELFGGYALFRSDLRLRPLLELPRLARRSVMRLPLTRNRAARRMADEACPEVVERYVGWQRVLPWEERVSLLGHSAPPLAETLTERYGPRLSRLHPTDQLLLLDSEVRMPAFINLTVDRMSMAHSVEARPPFLDHHLWEHVARQPPSAKVQARAEKALLRTAAAGLIPEEIRKRTKRGLTAPHHRFWAADRLPDWAEDHLTDEALGRAGYFDARAVRRLRARQRAGDRGLSRALMGVLTTQLWHQRFVGGPRA